MKYCLVFFLVVFFGGCILEHLNSKPPVGVLLGDLFWTSSGNKVILSADSSTENGNEYKLIRIYDNNANILKTLNISNPNSFSTILPSNDDTTFYSTSSLRIDSIYRYSFESSSLSNIAKGIIYGESSDRNHILIGPSGNAYPNNNFIILNLTGKDPIVQKVWYESTPQIRNAVWINNKNIGYFSYNSLNLINFVIIDTNGTKLDSFDVDGIGGINGIKTFYGQGEFYFAGIDGIIKLDSLTKIKTSIMQTQIIAMDIAPDGSYIIYDKNDDSPPSLTIINTRTGVSKSLPFFADYLKISPSGDHLAYIGDSKSYGGKLYIIPISAP